MTELRVTKGTFSPSARAAADAFFAHAQATKNDPVLLPTGLQMRMQGEFPLPAPQQEAWDKANAAYNKFKVESAQLLQSFDAELNSFWIKFKLERKRRETIDDIKATFQGKLFRTIVMAQAWANNVEPARIQETVLSSVIKHHPELKDSASEIIEIASKMINLVEKTGHTASPAPRL